MRFATIKGYHDYIIFDDGRIYNTLSNSYLVINNGKDFYRTVRLRKDNKPKTFKLHRLLAEAFLMKPDGKNYVNHKDGNKLNNDLSNLEWCTQAENMKHAFDNGMLYQSDLNKRRLVEVKQKPLLNVENGIFYDSIKEAAEVYGFGKRKIPKKLVRI